jgi:hypothetical protein
MNHNVAIGANGPEIPYGIHFILCPNTAKRPNVMDMDHTMRRGSVPFREA